MDTNGVVSDKSFVSFLLAIIFLMLALTMIILSVIYYLYWQPTQNITSLNSEHIVLGSDCAFGHSIIA